MLSESNQQSKATCNRLQSSADELPCLAAGEGRAGEGSTDKMKHKYRRRQRGTCLGQEGGETGETVNSHLLGEVK